MATPIQWLDTVAVRNDIPELGLTAGEVGAVVEVLSDSAFEVEFCDESGRTYAQHPLKGDQLLLLHVRGSAFRLRPEAA